MGDSEEGKQPFALPGSESADQLVTWFLSWTFTQFINLEISSPSSALWLCCLPLIDVLFVAGVQNYREDKRDFILVHRSQNQMFVFFLE